MQQLVEELREMDSGYENQKIMYHSKNIPNYPAIHNRHTKPEQKNTTEIWKELIRLRQFAMSGIPMDNDSLFVQILKQWDPITIEKLVEAAESTLAELTDEPGKTKMSTIPKPNHISNQTQSDKLPQKKQGEKTQAQKKDMRP